MRHFFGIILLVIFCYGGYLFVINLTGEILLGVALMVITAVLDMGVKERYS